MDHKTTQIIMSQRYRMKQKAVAMLMDIAPHMVEKLNVPPDELTDEEIEVIYSNEEIANEYLGKYAIDYKLLESEARGLNATELEGYRRA